MNLVVGATGVLGTEICRLLRQSGQDVAALVRKGSAPEKKQSLIKMGARLIEGDLRDSESLVDACASYHGANINAIISTATTITSRQEGDSFFKSDQEGHLRLIETAEKAGVKRFVFISFCPVPLEFPLQTAKRAVEDALKKSSIGYTILQPTLFQEVWLGPHLGFDAIGAKARIYGSGNNKISWISLRNVAEFAVRSLQDAVSVNRALPIGGPEDLTHLEVVKIFEEISGKKFELEFLPENALRTQYEAANDPVQKTFAALMLFAATGGRIERDDSAKRMGIQLQSVRDYAKKVLSA